MRYYDITITDPTSGAVVKRWSTIKADGNPDPGALKVEFDVFVTPAGTPHHGQSSFTIYGVSLNDLLNANNLFLKNIEVRAGFSGGLPLEKPGQAGVLFVGAILNSVGNWVGTDMSISLMLAPTSFTREDPGNFVLDWKKGQPLSEAIGEMLSRALPGMPQEINISGQIVAPSHLPMHAPTLELISDRVYEWTHAYFSHISSNFKGVRIGVRSGVIKVWDSVSPGGAKPLAFEDFIGQPNWIGGNKLEFINQLRADISVGDVVSMPANMAERPGFVQTQLNASPSMIHYQNTFTGNFIIQEVRHIGDSRSPKGEDWATVFIAAPAGDG